MNTSTIINSKPRTSLILLLASVLLLISTALSANEKTATTIDFTGLINGQPFITYKEFGFTASSLSGNWIADTTSGSRFISFKNPDGKNAVTASIKVTNDDSTFKFNSVDLYSSTTPIPYEFTGYLKSKIVFKVTGTIPNTFGNFATATNSHNTDVIDKLEITLTNPGGQCCPGNPMGLDNIVLTPSHPYTVVQSIRVADLNGNGFPEEATLVRNNIMGALQVLIRDSTTKSLLKIIGLVTGNYAPIGLVEVPHLYNSRNPKIAVLLSHQTTNEVSVVIHDALTGALVKKIGFGKVDAKSVAVFEDTHGTGVPEIAVTAFIPATDTYRMDIRDTLSGKLVRTITLP